MSHEIHDGTADYWRKSVNEILYVVQFEKVLSDDLAEVAADAIVNRRVLGKGSAQYIRAIGEALGQDGIIDTQIETPHSEADVRAFLERLRVILGSKAGSSERGSAGV